MQHRNTRLLSNSKIGSPNSLSETLKLFTIFLDSDTCKMTSFLRTIIKSSRMTKSAVFNTVRQRLTLASFETFVFAAAAISIAIADPRRRNARSWRIAIKLFVRACEVALKKQKTTAMSRFYTNISEFTIRTEQKISANNYLKWGGTKTCEL